MRSVIVIFLVMIVSQKVLAQDSTLLKGDSMQYTKDFVWREGIYLSYKDFRNNNPIPKLYIDEEGKREEIDFIGKIIEKQAYIHYTMEGVSFKVSTDSLWGFSENNGVFINHEKRYFRLPNLGNISQFIAMVDVYRVSNGYSQFGYDYGMTATNMPVKGKELRQFILDFYTGDVLSFSYKQLEELLKRDEVIYKEYMKIKRSKRRKMIGSFVRKYNTAHPIYFLR